MKFQVHIQSRLFGWVPVLNLSAGGFLNFGYDTFKEAIDVMAYYDKDIYRGTQKLRIKVITSK